MAMLMVFLFGKGDLAISWRLKDALSTKLGQKIRAKHMNVGI